MSVAAGGEIDASGADAVIDINTLLGVADVDQTIPTVSVAAGGEIDASGADAVNDINTLLGVADHDVEIRVGSEAESKESEDVEQTIPVPTVSVAAGMHQAARVTGTPRIDTGDTDEGRFLQQLADIASETNGTASDETAAKAQLAFFRPVEAFRRLEAAANKSVDTFKKENPLLAANVGHPVIALCFRVEADNVVVPVLLTPEEIEALFEDLLFLAIVTYFFNPVNMLPFMDKTGKRVSVTGENLASSFLSMISIVARLARLPVGSVILHACLDPLAIITHPAKYMRATYASLDDADKGMLTNSLRDTLEACKSLSLVQNICSARTGHAIAACETMYGLVPYVNRIISPHPCSYFRHHVTSLLGFSAAPFLLIAGETGLGAEFILPLDVVARLRDAIRKFRCFATGPSTLKKLACMLRPITNCPCPVRRQLAVLGADPRVAAVLAASLCSTVPSEELDMIEKLRALSSIEKEKGSKVPFKDLPLSAQQMLAIDSKDAAYYAVHTASSAVHDALAVVGRRGGTSRWCVTVCACARVPIAGHTLHDIRSLRSPAGRSNAVRVIYATQEAAAEYVVLVDGRGLHCVTDRSPTDRFAVIVKILDGHIGYADVNLLHEWLQDARQSGSVTSATACDNGERTSRSDIPYLILSPCFLVLLGSLRSGFSFSHEVGSV